MKISSVNEAEQKYYFMSYQKKYHHLNWLLEKQVYLLMSVTPFILSKNEIGYELANFHFSANFRGYCINPKGSKDGVSAA